MTTQLPSSRVCPADCSHNRLLACLCLLVMPLPAWSAGAPEAWLLHAFMACSSLACCASCIMFSLPCAPAGGGKRRKLEAGGSLPERIGAELERSLRDFVALATVSRDPAYREDCFRGAKFLGTLLESLGMRRRPASSSASSIREGCLLHGFRARCWSPWVRRRPA